MSDKTKLDLFNILIKQKNVFGDSDYKITDFLEEIWDLRLMPSTDVRFNDAHGDISQHVINNNDWSLDQLFIERLNLLKDDKIFFKFIETIVLPKYKQNSEVQIINFVELINSFLEIDNLKLVIKDYNTQGLPIYSVQEKSDIESLPIDIKLNNIPFHLKLNYSGRADRQTYSLKESNLIKEQKNPFFILLFDSGWNDYSIRGTFHLYFCKNEDEIIYIGELKIIRDDETDNISTALKDSFLKLDENFCSLGQSKKYYTNLKEYLGIDFESILFALKDAAYFPLIQEKFEKRQNFRSSLIRYDDAERLLREAKYILNDYNYDLSKLYSFKYMFSPIFSKKGNPIEINFDFNNNKDLPNRIYAIVGKNGTGKTQLITSLPIDISQKSEKAFSPKVPLFSKVISVSYSVFDRFRIPKKTASFNYVYCGLRKDDGDFISEQGLVLRFHYTWKTITRLERVNQWRKILLTFLDNELVDEFLVPVPDSPSYSIKYEMNTSGFNKIRDKLSSGQGIVLYIISEIVANIRFDSLIIYDEPETHLHPNAITQLVSTIYELVDEFESYCLIATHSPLVIRELLSRNVYVIEREGNNSTVRRISLESFGENLSSLTDEVFGNKDIKKQSKTILQRLINRGKTFDEITALLEYDNVPLSLNTRILIKSLLKEKNEKQ